MSKKPTKVTEPILQILLWNNNKYKLYYNKQLTQIANL